MLISEIAEHTRNLLKDPRASLFVADPDPAGDPQATWRLTIMGRARRLRARSDARDVAGAEDAIVLEDDAFRAIHARYTARVPDAPRYFDAHRFGYWRLEPPARARNRRLRRDPLAGRRRAAPRDPQGGGLAESASAITEHMNDDHEAALIDIVAAASGERPRSARMLAIDRAGFLVATRTPDALRFVEFGREIHAADARAVFVELTKRARESANAGSRTLDAGELFAGGDTLQIDHRGALYTLRITRNDRMILTK